LIVTPFTNREKLDRGQSLLQFHHNFVVGVTPVKGQEHFVRRHGFALQ
jgi:hypothetical protein